MDSVNLSTDYQIFDEGDTTTQLESATYYTRVSTLGIGTYIPIAITKVIKLDTKTVEGKTSWGVYVKSYCDWDLRTQDFTIYTPKVGDYIIDGENIGYIITSVRRPVFSDYWGISTVSPHIVGGDYLIPRKASETTDEYGDRKITYTNGVTILGWVQPTTQTVEDMFGKRGFIEDYAIYMLTNSNIVYGDLILDPEGTEYEIYEVNDSKKIDELQLLKGVIKP